MLSRALIEDDVFTSISKDARLFYFYLNLEADDDGFVSSIKKLAAFADVEPNVVKELVEAGFLLEFESKVVLIRHWHRCNKVAPTRYHPTVHQKEKQMIMLNEESKTYEYINQNVYKMSTSCLQNGNNLETNGLLRLDKTSIDKIRLVESSEDEFSSVESSEDETRLSVSQFSDYEEAFDKAVNN